MYTGVWTQAQTLISRFICYFPPFIYEEDNTLGYILKSLYKCFISTITIKSVGDGSEFTSLHHTIIHGAAQLLYNCANCIGMRKFYNYVKKIFRI